MLHSQRKIITSQAMEVDLAEESRISLKSAYGLMGRQVGGQESLGYTKLDQKNYLKIKRQKDLAYGKAWYLLKYFSDEILKIHHFSTVCSWIMRNRSLIYFRHMRR